MSVSGQGESSLDTEATKIISNWGGAPMSLK